jgi:hypothetical protein
MKKRYPLSVCALSAALLLSLTACGGGAASASQEDSALLEQISALQAENTALQEQLDTLQAQLDAQQGADADTPDPVDPLAEDPIDAFYAGVETNGSTVALSFVAECRENAWRAEVEHLAQQIKAQLPLEEDKDLVEEYLSAAEEQTQRMNVMAIYPISDLTGPQNERVMSSGTQRGILWPEARASVWQDTFWQLSAVNPSGEYTFLFSTDAAQQELDAALGGT